MAPCFAPRAPIILVPARLGSSRLPGKALADIGGESMIVHAWRRAVAAALGPVAVATDSEEIAQAVRAAGGAVVMTSPDHACGGDRVAEAVEKLDPARRHDAVVNLQGDNPFLPEGALAAALALLDDPAADIGTLATRASHLEADDPNAVKLVGAALGGNRLRALYFTRARAPHGDGPLLKHIGVYAFRRESLARFAALAPSPLEMRERLEQLRALEAGMRIDAAVLDKASPSVDTEGDLAALRAAAIWQENQ
jgi:3-deoxy-manno-octulosonate cytidylyltransferase (CMP-KDO synthetase)